MAERRPGVPVLAFLGGAGTVTGSRFLVETASARVLVDCGLFQGRKDLRLRNWDPFPVEATSVDAVVLTHAHLDHCGFLPRLDLEGFTGPVMATGSTADLAAIVLADSGHLQEEDAAYANRKGFSKHRPALPLYTEADAHRVTGRFRTLDYGHPVELASGIELTLRRAGHILGSATVTLRVDSARTLVFSGDLGRPSHPLLAPPEPPGPADVVVVESTYGDRDHEDHAGLDRLADAITRTARRGGTVVIPAFAVDRTEVVLLHLARLAEAGAIPELPVYVDSPMALASLAVYRRAVADGDAEIRPELAGLPDCFDPGRLVEVRDVEASKALDRSPVPSIILSASGMATGGRVLHHLARFLPDPRNLVVLVGFQAEGTRGRSLQRGDRHVKMLGRYVPARAEVLDLQAFSVHAGRSELLAWLGGAPGPPDATFVVHGEPDASAALRDAIEDDLGWTAVVPRLGERVRLD